MFVPPNNGGQEGKKNTHAHRLFDDGQQTCKVLRCRLVYLVDGEVRPAATALMTFPIPKRIREVGRVSLQRRLVQFEIGPPNLNDDGAVGMPKNWMRLGRSSCTCTCTCTPV